MKSIAIIGWLGLILANVGIWLFPDSNLWIFVTIAILALLSLIVHTVLSLPKMNPARRALNKE